VVIVDVFLNEFKIFRVFLIFPANFVKRGEVPLFRPVRKAPDGKYLIDPFPVFYDV